MSNFNSFLEQNPEAKQKMDTYNQQAVNMMNGGMVRKNFAAGGVPKIKQDTIDRMKTPKIPTGGKVTVKGTSVLTDQLIAAGKGQVQGSDPKGTTSKAYAGQASVFDPRTQPSYLDRIMYGDVQGTGYGYDSPARSTADSGVFKTDTTRSGDRIESELDKTTAAEGAVSDGATVGAEQTTKSSVSDLATTEGTSIDVKRGIPKAGLYRNNKGQIVDESGRAAAVRSNLPSNAFDNLPSFENAQAIAVSNRKMEIGERVDPVADAASAATFTEEIQAATATPTEKATVKGQLAELMTDFEGKPKSGLYRDDKGQIVDESGRSVSVQIDPDNPNAYDNLPSLSEAKAQASTTPAWAAGAMRAATTAMAARGLGASSMAGQALVQAAMESSLPIAMADAGTFAKFESQNLSNRQQRSMLAAEQRAAFIGQEFDQKFQARVINATKVSDIADMNFNADQQVALENSRAANTVNLANMSNTQALLMGEVAALANLDMANLSNRQQAAVLNAQAFLATDMANLK